MTAKLIKKIDLNNGLQLEFIDTSRKIAGDRYRVELKTRVEVPVEKYWSAKQEPPAPDLADILKTIGNTVVFEQTKERNFVDSREKEAVLDNISAVAEDFCIRYIGHADFPKKLILKRYNEKR